MGHRQAPELLDNVHSTLGDHQGQCVVCQDRKRRCGCAAIKVPVRKLRIALLHHGQHDIWGHGRVQAKVVAQRPPPVHGGDFYVLRRRSEENRIMLVSDELNAMSKTPGSTWTSSTLDSHHWITFRRVNGSRGRQVRKNSVPFAESAHQSQYQASRSMRPAIHMSSRAPYSRSFAFWIPVSFTNSTHHHWHKSNEPSATSFESTDLSSVGQENRRPVSKQ
ncbi:hypothetical protein BC828DRAFT_212938 [Blastocladiella britannica]|nr:hypothetical protein BC828DRAFT_212938 [Blastocladiella britannica]